MASAVARHLGDVAAEALGYTSRGEFISMTAYNEEWVGSLNGKKLLKGQMFPSIKAMARSIEILQPEYSVTFYFQGGNLGDITPDGTRIFGWGGDTFPDDWQPIARVLVAWKVDPLYQDFLRQFKFLKREPMYRLRPKTTVQKRVYASQVEV